MREQIDRLRKEKKDLEAKLGGVDLQQMHIDNNIIQKMEDKVELNITIQLANYFENR